jgi:serine/threonine-protein kinase
MKPERWKQVDELLEAALDCPAAERATFLDRACAGDEGLRRELESLLISDEQAGAFIESPPARMAADLLSESQAKPGKGERIAHYEILAPLGSGGMGEVYVARDIGLGRKVALKLLPPSLTADAQLRARFFREAQLASTLDHPNICTIHEVGQSANSLFIAMQYIEGETLKEFIGSRPLKLDALLSISLQVANALAAAHDQGIIHRDIKSNNIIITPRGQVKVLDFGLAKAMDGSDRREGKAETELTANLTRTGAVMGTPNYMSPEQARGERVDHRSDVFSLGVVIYEMASGKVPFKRKSQTETMNAVINEPHRPVAEFNEAIPAQLSAVIDRALAKEPAERYQGMGEMLADLRQVGRSVGLVGSSDSQGAVIPYRPLVAPSRRRLGLRRWPSVLAGLLLLGVLLVALNVGGLRERLLGKSNPLHIQSLAVLPMENFSGDASQDYFADGMTDALITDLAKISALRVISRPAVMQYKGEHKPLPEIGRDLNVDALVAGSVVRSGDRVRINVQLIQAATNRNLWANSYERDLRDVLALQREVTRDIVSEIRIKLTPQEQVRFGSVREVNPEAYDHYLRGKFYLYRQSRDNNEAAITALERAVAADPTFAAAQAELAQACVWRLFLFTPNEKQWEEKAFVAVEKALSLDPDLAEAYLARGRLLWTPANHFPHDQAIQEYRRALVLNPSLDEARNQLALVYGHVGLLDEALQELEKAMATNPGNTLARFRVGEMLLFQGKYEQSLSALRNVPRESNPAIVGHLIVWALFNLGRKEEAAAELEQFLKDYPEDNRGLYTSLQAVLAAAAGQTRRAEEKIQLAVERGKGFGHFHHTAYHIACAYALMKNAEQAI